MSEIQEEIVQEKVPYTNKLYHGGMLDAKQLDKYKYFTIVFHDNEKIAVKLLKLDKYNMKVETEKGILLVPKHAIKYWILESFEDEE